MKHKITFEKVDILQILDALRCRVQLWDRTVIYLSDDYVDGEVAECSDLHEAESILVHYEDIIKSIELQMT